MVKSNEINNIELIKINLIEIKMLKIAICEDELY